MLGLRVPHLQRSQRPVDRFFYLEELIQSKVLGRLSVCTHQSASGIFRPDESDAVPRPPRVPPHRHHQRYQIKAMVCMQMGQHDCVHLGRMQQSLQGAERPAAHVQEYPEVFGFDQIARRGGTGSWNRT